MAREPRQDHAHEWCRPTRRVNIVNMFDASLQTMHRDTCLSGAETLYQFHTWLDHPVTVYTNGQNTLLGYADTGQ